MKYRVFNWSDKLVKVLTQQRDYFSWVSQIFQKEEKEVTFHCNKLPEVQINT